MTSLKFTDFRIKDNSSFENLQDRFSISSELQLIKDSDYICDPLAKKDFCRTIGITVQEFDETVDKFANKDILVKDANGKWRRKDLL